MIYIDIEQEILVALIETLRHKCAGDISLHQIESCLQYHLKNNVSEVWIGTVEK